MCLKAIPCIKRAGTDLVKNKGKRRENGSDRVTFTGERGKEHAENPECTTPVSIHSVCLQLHDNYIERCYNVETR